MLSTRRPSRFETRLNTSGVMPCAFFSIAMGGATSAAVVSPGLTASCELASLGAGASCDLAPLGPGAGWRAAFLQLFRCCAMFE